MRDSDALLAAARRPLVVGIGGGGDVVGALATYESCRLAHGAAPRVGGVAWERRPVDPVPGPRSADEIEGAQELAPGVLLATQDTRVRGREVVFAESHMAGFLAEPVLLLDITVGAPALADGLAAAVEALAADLLVLVDVGGDALANGSEPGLASPLCDAVVLAAGARAAAAGVPVLGGLFGIGCDGELTPDEVLERLAEVAAAGGLAGMRGLTEPVVRRLEDAMRAVPTEASAQAVRCFRGDHGVAEIRQGRRTVPLSPLGALTAYFDVEVALRSAARLAAAVWDASSLEDANDLLHALGVRSELDYEREMAAAPPAPETAR